MNYAAQSLGYGLLAMAFCGAVALGCHGIKLLVWGLLRRGERRRSPRDKPGGRKRR